MNTEEANHPLENYMIKDRFLVRKNKYKVLENVAWFIMAIIAFDGMCFVAWIVTNQTPIVHPFFGSITAHILKLFF